MEGSTMSNSSSSTKFTDVIDVSQLGNFSDWPALCLDPSTTDWQGKTRTLSESFEYIFSKNLFCDVTFIVGEDDKIQKMSANKMVLSARSSVFYTMFSERWSSGCDERKEPDVEPTAFAMMLRFLYSDKISLTVETVMEVIYVAKKYLIVALEDKCIDFLSRILSPENAFTILIVARTFNLEKLVEDCLKVIAVNTMDTLQTKDFFNIDVDTLCLVLKRSDLTISELPLFKAVLSWSEAACQKKDLPINPENQRSVLKDAPLLLRFPLMSFEDFASEVVASGILTEKETISAFLHFSHNSKPSVFSEVHRHSFFVVNRFQSAVTSRVPVVDSGSNFTNLVFTPDRHIKLIGIGLYGSPDHSTKYKVDIHLSYYQTGEKVGQISEWSQSSKKIFRVLFNQPVCLRAGFKYKIEVTTQGHCYVYGKHHLSTVTVTNHPDAKVTINFGEGQYGGMSDCYGQIPEFLINF